MIKRRCYWIATYSIFAIDICIVLFYVGTNKIGYAGIDKEYGLKEYAHAVIDILSGNLARYTEMTILGMLFLFVLLFLLMVQNRLREYGMYILMSMAGFGYISASQLFLYAKSGMFERYLIPITTGFAIFWLIDISYIVLNENVAVTCYYVFVAFITMGLISGNDYEDRAIIYAEDGKSITKAFEKIAECKTSRPNIIVSIDYEMDLSASVYLQEKYGIREVYNLKHNKGGDGRAYDDWIQEQDERDAIEFEEADIYLGYVWELKEVLEKNRVPLDEFNAYVYGNYIIFINKEIESSQIDKKLWREKILRGKEYMGSEAIVM